MIRYGKSSKKSLYVILAILLLINLGLTGFGTFYHIGANFVDMLSGGTHMLKNNSFWGILTGILIIPSWSVLFITTFGLGLIGYFQKRYLTVKGILLTLLFVPMITNLVISFGLGFSYYSGFVSLLGFFMMWAVFTTLSRWQHTYNYEKKRLFFLNLSLKILSIVIILTFGMNIMAVLFGAILFLLVSRYYV